MIKRFVAQNYKALRDVTVELTPIHLLIGPNDSGKTSILEALAALCRSVDHHLRDAFTGSWDGHQLVWQGDVTSPVSLGVTAEQEECTFDYELSTVFLPNQREAHVETEEFRYRFEQEAVDLPLVKGSVSRVWRTVVQSEDASPEVRNATRLVYDALAGVHNYTWNPRLLALPVAPDSKRRFRMEPSGFGLAQCLDDILGFDRARFEELESRFKAVFPQLKSIKLMYEPAYQAPVDNPEQIPMLHKAEGKGIYFEFSGDSQLVPASQVSGGMLMVLAYLAVLYLPQPPRVVLIEEPENCIYPKRLEEVITILRELVAEQRHTQVVLTSHSPYLVDLFGPEEVSLCQKQEDGSVSVRRLSESQAVRDQIDLFTLGEIWTGEEDDALAKTAKGIGEAAQ